MSTSDSVNGPQAYVFMPEQAAPPIPAVATADAACIYTDGVFAYLSVGGGAYAPIQTGSGAVTLNAAYGNGPAGNTISMTDALGPIIFSSAITTGPILSVLTTNAPATATAAVTGLSIDMSSLGTAATPSTFDMPAIKIVGARSSVAKTRGLGVVQVLSGYRNATAVSINLMNKQAAAGSAVMVGWNATNYEGAAASSILTGTTHVVTIDGQTNVDAATNNVAFVGQRILVPLTSSTSTRGIVVSSLQSAGQLLELSTTSATTLAGALVGLSVDFANVAATAQRVSGISLTLPASSSTSATAVTALTLQTAGTLFAGSFSGATTLSGVLVGLSVDLATSVDGNNKQVRGIYAATPSNCSTTSSAAYLSSGTLRGQGPGVGILNVKTNVAGTTTGTTHFVEIGADTAGYALGGDCTGIDVDLSSNITPSSNALNGITLQIGATAFAGGKGFGAIVVQSAATIQRVLDLNFQNVNGTVVTMQAYSSNITLTSTIALWDIDVRTSTFNITGGLTNAITGYRIFMPATSSASSYCFVGDSTQTAGAGLFLTMAPGSAGAVVGAQVTMGANATGAALSITHSGTGANQNQLVFTAAVDGTGAHVRGPATAALVIKAGVSTGSAAGRDITCTAGAASTSGAGGNFFVTTGAAAGAGANGGDVNFTTGALAGTGRRGFVSVSGAFAETTTAVTFNAAGTTTVACGDGNCFTTTATGATTWAFSKPMDTGFIYIFVLVLTNGGAGVQTWTSAGTGGTAVKWPGGVAPTLQAAGVDVLTFFTTDGGTTWRGQLSQSDSK